MLFIKKKEVISSPYDDITLKEVIALYENFGDRVIIHNGHIVGFSKE